MAMKTKWFDKVGDKPLNEYPRPQFVRDNWTNLNGWWDFTVTEAEVIPVRFDEQIRVPFAIESRLSGVEKALQPHEILWYRRTISVDKKQGNRYLLHFGAVDWECDVFVDKQRVGSHIGGYLPFHMDITDYIKGDCELIVKVKDPTDKHWQQKGKQSLKPKGVFYTASSGIWQTVWLECVNDNHIKNVRVTPDMDHQRIQLIPSISGEGLVKAIINEGNRTIYEAILPEDGWIEISNPKLWSPSSPFLYDVEYELISEGIVTDRVESYFAMRKFHRMTDKTGMSRLALNNEILFMHGPLDQGYFPDGLYTAPTDEALRFDIEETKALGFNMTRKHIKVEPMRWYHWCDKIGLIVWQDMVNGGKPGTSYLQYAKQYLFNDMTGRDDTDRSYRRNGRFEASRVQYESELLEMIDLLYNVPSIGMWVPFNECWGQFDAARIAELVKKVDPSRLVDHASGWLEQGAGDVVSLHRYTKPLYFPKMNDDRAMILSEYGGYTLPVAGHVWSDKVFSYMKFEDGKALEKAYESLIKDQLMPLKEQGCGGAVYTQWTDVEIEINGYYTYDREVLKIDRNRLRELNDLLTGETAANTK